MAAVTELINYDARRCDLYSYRNWWAAGQTVEFAVQPEGFPHEVIVRGKLLGFTGGEFPGDGYAYAYVEVEGKYQYRLRADNLIVKARG